MHRRSFVWLAFAGCVAPPKRTEPEPHPGSGSPAVSPRPAQGPSVPAMEGSPLEARAERLREAYGTDGFTVVVQAPFVVIGNESAEVVTKRSSSTVGWAVARLKEAYFAQDPEHIIDVWLFADEDSYRSWALTLFGDEPDTPFGYYTSEHAALVMNIATGGGTLVHEIVHPFMAANFPACPSWFDEGLASLYEQCGDEDGAIWGYTNWRLPGLQAAIRDGSLPTFAELTATTRHAFYQEDPGTHYAQSRYLCYYLQEQGLLRAFYHAFATAAPDDPTGYGTLRRILGNPDMKRFQSDWERFVMGLRFG